jgi:glycerol-3-phosphate dehydrogenase subunit B
VTGDAYRGGHTDANALVPVVGGAVKPTARYPASVAPGLASDGRPALLVGFESDPDFDAPLAAAHLRAAGVPFDVRGVTVRFPGEFQDDAAVTRLASALDRNETVSDGRGVRAALADRIRPHLDGEARVGLPALLGQDHPAEVRAALSAALDADVFEVPTGPPSVPGLRLESQLQAALRDAGVRLTLGDPVIDADGDRRVRSLAVDREGRTVQYAPGAVVLATGGLVGKGVDSDRDSVTEPAFGCHVPAPSDRTDRAAEAPFGDHAFARFGVRTDGDLRPLDADGDPEFGNLFAAGSVLGGYDFAAEKSGSGVSLSTGLVAGRRAAEVVA